MASMYSWSCKRSYRTGFVWHDLCEDDIILPAHGNEYVHKVSELFDEPNSGSEDNENNLFDDQALRAVKRFVNGAIDEFDMLKSLPDKRKKLKWILLLINDR